LPEVVQAHRPLTPLARQAQGGNEKRQQDRYDCDHDQQFNQRERSARAHGGLS
jgi:hypothetical protein